MGMSIEDEREMRANGITNVEIKHIKQLYENRLKADMVAMLTEIQLEIDEKATELCDDGWWLTYNDIIQQKINSLKENNDGSNNN